MVQTKKTFIDYFQMKQKELEAMTPWEQYLAKKKEKRKAKKERSKNSEKPEVDGDGEKPFSDDELPDGIDPDDPFFKSADSGQEDGGGKKKNGKSKKKGKKGKPEKGGEKVRNSKLSFRCGEALRLTNWALS